MNRSNSLSGEMLTRSRPLSDWKWYTTRIQRRSLLRLLAVAAEENLSLIPLLECWADDEQGRQRWRTLRLIRLLNEGRTLPEAIEAVPGILREEDVLAIRFDAQSGTRTDAMRTALAQQDAVEQAAAIRARRPIAYLCVVLPIGLLVVSFLQTKIVPVLQKIYSEFGASPSGGMRLSAEVTRAFTQGGWLLTLGLLVTIFLMFSTEAGRKLRRTAFGKFFRPLHQWHIADVLQKIGLASRAGRPVQGALSTLARYHFDPRIRQELLYVRNEMEQGADIWNSMRDIGMLTSADVRALRTAEYIGNLPWVLEQLAEVKRRSTTRRFHRWSELVLPAIVLLMAAFVLLQAFAVFEPLVQLIQSLT